MGLKYCCSISSRLKQAFYYQELLQGHMNLETHHPLLSMETNSNALFEFLIAGLGNHLTAAPEYGIC